MLDMVQSCIFGWAHPLGVTMIVCCVSLVTLTTAVAQSLPIDQQALWLCCKFCATVKQKQWTFTRSADSWALQTSPQGLHVPMPGRFVWADSGKCASLPDHGDVMCIDRELEEARQAHQSLSAQPVGPAPAELSSLHQQIQNLTGWCQA